MSSRIGKPLIVTPLFTSSFRTFSIVSSALQLSGPSPDTSMMMRAGLAGICGTILSLPNETFASCR